MKKGFTLLEITIVLIIVAVLAGLALPRLFSTVEYSRSTEAFMALQAQRSSIERCYAQVRDYTQCSNVDSLDIENPATSPGSHFTYKIAANGAAGGFTLTATRNAVDGGDSISTIWITQDNTAGTVKKGGTGAYKGVK